MRYTNHIDCCFSGTQCTIIQWWYLYMFSDKRLPQIFQMRNYNSKYSPLLISMNKNLLCFIGTISGKYIQIIIKFTACTVWNIALHLVLGHTYILFGICTSDIHLVHIHTAQINVFQLLCTNKFSLQWITGTYLYHWLSMLTWDSLKKFFNRSIILKLLSPTISTISPVWNLYYNTHCKIHPVLL